MRQSGSDFAANQHILHIMHELRNIFERYINPILDEFLNPLSAARFQVSAMTELRSKGLSVEEPRYNVVNDYVSTAILYLEANHIQESKEILLKGLENLKESRIYRSPRYIDMFKKRVEKILDYLDNFPNARDK